MSRPSRRRRSRTWRGRLVVLAAIVLVGLNLRIAVAAVSPIFGAVRETFPVSTTQVGLLGTIPVASFALFGSLAAPLGRGWASSRRSSSRWLLAVVGELLRGRRAEHAGVPRLVGDRARRHGHGQRAAAAAGEAVLPGPHRGGHGGVLGRDVGQHGRAAAGRAAGRAGRGLARLGRACGRSSGSRRWCRGWSSIARSVAARSHLREILRRAPRAERPALLVRSGRAGVEARLALAAGLGAGADVLRQHHRHLRDVRVAAADPGRRRPGRRRRRSLAGGVRDPRAARRARSPRS